jgi:hypothetical protein
VLIIIGAFFFLSDSVGKIIALVMFLPLAYEFSSGRYKKYVTDQVTGEQAREEARKVKKTLLPFIILAVVFLILFLVYAFQNWL